MDASSTVLDADFATSTNQMNDRDLMVGFTSKKVLIKLREEVEQGRQKQKTLIGKSH